VVVVMPLIQLESIDWGGTKIALGGTLEHPVSTAIVGWSLPRGLL